MSLLTRCPACITLYRVVPDQLRISDGWVKCGQCGEIFDASQHLVEEANDPALASDLPDTAHTEDDLTTLTVEDTSWMNPAVPGTGPVVQAELAVDVVRPFEEHSADVQQAQTPENEPGDLSNGERQADVVPVSDPTRLRWDDQSPVQPSEVAIPDPVTITDEAPVTFLAGAGRPTLWQKPIVRVVLALLCLLLGLSLAAQWIYMERDRLAGQHPALKPVLLAFCGVADCQVQTQKNIESLSVDSVEFHLLGKDTYRLKFVVKNAAALPLALPNVELTLTDSADKPVFRRVLSVEEMYVAQAAIAAGGEWPVVMDLRVKPITPDQRVLGYRLLVFYP
jgi:predicted Zn finger-like uncharacterized protein